MPHVIVEYSANAEEFLDVDEFCNLLRRAAVGTGMFREKGVRVRAIRFEHYAIADGDSANCFIDVSVRIRGGRPLDGRKKAVEQLFDACRSHLANEMERRPIALSMEMRNIDPELSPKANSIGSGRAERT